MMTKKSTSTIAILLFGFFLATCCMLFSNTAIAEECRLEVVEAVWTDGIADQNPGLVYHNTAQVGPLYLWMRVKGSKWALQRLQNAGKLPIHHQWFRHTIIGVDPEGITQMIETIKVSAGDSELSDKLQTEIEHHGYFDWRTWSMKENIRSGKWVVKVFYDDGSAVLCADGRACEYKISVP